MLDAAIDRIAGELPAADRAYFAVTAPPNADPPCEFGLRDPEVPSGSKRSKVRKVTISGLSFM